MLLTVDLLREHPLETICDAINHKYNFQLDPSLIEIETLEDLGDGLTKVTIDYKRSISPTNVLPVITEKTFTYKRLHVRHLFKDINIIDDVLPKTTLDLMRLNNPEFLIDRLDIINEDILTHGVDYNLKANPESLRFYGEGYFDVGYVNRLDIGTLNNNNFPNLIKLENHSNVDNYNGSIILRGFDFSLHSLELKTFREMNKETIRNLIRIINAINNRMFVDSSELVEYNLRGSKIVYNGSTSKLFNVRKDLDSCLIIELDSNFCSNINGYLLMHYN